MKQNKGICIFICMGILFFTLVGSVIYKEFKKPNAITEKKMITTYDITSYDTTENVVESMTDAKAYKYQIILQDNHLTVVYADTQEIFFDTGIKENEISEELRDQIRKGLYLKNDKELYDFLESYSS